MTTSNPAVGARSGTFFVDRPDGFVWWVTSQRAPSGVRFRWARFYGLRACDWDYATQEEAEAAGLVPLVAETEVRCTEEGPNGQCDQDARLGHFCSRKGHPIDSVETSSGERFTPGIPAAPAPLDPGNPDHLRQVREAVLKLRSEADEKEYAALGTVAIMLAAKIVRLDRERAEAEQEAKDAHRAECIAAEVYASGSVTIGHLSEAALAGIRAGRAEGSAS